MLRALSDFVVVLLILSDHLLFQRLLLGSLGLLLGTDCHFDVKIVRVVFAACGAPGRKVRDCRG